MGHAYAPKRGRSSACATCALVGALIATMASACGSKAVGVDTCKQIETARCQAAPACNFPITPPDYTSGTDVAACIRYYDVACLDGLQVSAPTSAEVTACIASINGNCAYVSTPQDSPECAWLSTTPDAGNEVDATDAADAGDAADATEASSVDADDSGD
jgi:hypothetical protein